MTLDKLVYDIREAMKEYSDDSELSNRYIEYLISIKRAKFLKQSLDKFGRNFSNTILQTFCSPIETVSPDECGLDISCKTIARTKLFVPTLLELSTKSALSRVAPSSKLSKPFNIIDRNRAPFAGSSIFNGTKVFLHDDDRLYFINKDEVFHFDCISVTGVFEDPSELKNYKDCCECDGSEPCFDPYVNTYPIPPNMIDDIRKSVLADLIPSEKLPQDTQNNSQDDR